MPISEQQLNTWSHQGSITNSADTANSVKYAINNYKNFPNHISFETYLSGSYKNDTNVYGESDVDVVVELTSSFYNNLTEERKQAFGFTTATYGYFEFQRDVLTCLREYYGNQYIEVGNKAVKISPPNQNRLYADVLICSTYRHYTNFYSENGYQKGVAFYTRNDGRRIINFPKKHSESATTKHQQTNSWFKPTVRIFKNIRNTLVNRGIITKESAPSYFIECMLYNVPDYMLQGSYTSCVYNTLDFLSKYSWGNFMCINDVRPLWGDTDENWNINSAGNFIIAVKNLWNNRY